jgi:hypothetical protein
VQRRRIVKIATDLTVAVAARVATPAITTSTRQVQRQPRSLRFEHLQFFKRSRETVYAAYEDTWSLGAL